MVSGGLVAPFWGRFLDRHGPRLTIAIAQAIVGTAWLLRSQARSLPVFYASFALAFLGLPGPVLSVPRALGAAFPARKGTVIGFATTGASVLSMILVPAADFVITSSGWPAACVMFASTNAFALLVALALFDVDHKPAPPRAGKGCCRGLCDGTFLLVATACNIGQLSYAAAGGSLVPFLAESGLQPSDAALLAGPVVAIPNILGKLGFGRLADSCLGPPFTFSIVFGVLALSLALFALVASSTPLAADGSGGEEEESSRLLLLGSGTVLFGCGYGAFIAVQHTVSLPTSSFGRGSNPLELLDQTVMHVFGFDGFASAMGCIQSLVIIPGLAGPVLTGVLHDATGSYAVAFALVVSHAPSSLASGLHCPKSASGGRVGRRGCSWWRAA